MTLDLFRGQATIGTTHGLLQRLNISIRSSLKQGATREIVSTKQSPGRNAIRVCMAANQPAFLAIAGELLTLIAAIYSDVTQLFLSLMEKSPVEWSFLLHLVNLPPLNHHNNGITIMEFSIHKNTSKKYPLPFWYTLNLIVHHPAMYSTTRLT